MEGEAMSSIPKSVRTRSDLPNWVCPGFEVYVEDENRYYLSLEPAADVDANWIAKGDGWVPLARRHPGLLLVVKL